MKSTKSLICWSLLVMGAIAPVSFGAAKPSVPAPTLADEMARTRIDFADGYLDARPRILFGPDARKAMAAKADSHKERWAPVLRQARAMGKYVPDSDMVRNGTKYWRAEYMLSGALAYFVTGEKAYRDNTVKWMIAHCTEDVWGTAYNSNHDLEAAWYLYYISLAYDILHDDLTDLERNAIRAGLIDHAEVIYESKLPPQQYRYDQNHTYIPTTALLTAGLTLKGETELADKWLKLTEALMTRCRYALGTDGYYYEGTGYATYAMHWHVRYADMMSRATGRTLHDLPTLKDFWAYNLYMDLPGPPYVYDVGDTGSNPTSRPKVRKFKWDSMMYGVDTVLRAGYHRATADRMAAISVAPDDPAMYFLWYCPQVKPIDLKKLPACRHFADHGVVTWRSSWNKDATCYMFKAGPPQGHAAAKKLKQMNDWKMNSGHVHPDIGAFWMFAGGEYLVVGTGYTGKKFTKDHNTLLVDGHGQALDGKYHAYRDYPYDLLDKVRITKTHLTDAYGYVAADLSGAYVRLDAPTMISIQRQVLMTDRYLLVIDDLSDHQPHEYAWLIHTDTPIEKTDAGFASAKGKATLNVYPLAPANLTSHIGPAVVQAGTSPLKAVPTERGYELKLTTPKAKTQRIVTLLAPVAAGEQAPATVTLAPSDDKQIVVRIERPGQPAEVVQVNLTWQQGTKAEPVKIRQN